MPSKGLESGRKRPYLRTLVSLTVICGLAAWGVWYLSGHIDEFRRTLSWSPGTLAALSLLVLVHYALLGLFNQIILQTFGLNLVFREWYGLGIVTTLGNYLIPPRGGAAIRAGYLKKRHDFPLTHFMSTFVAFYVFNLIPAGLAGLAALVFIPDVSAEAGYTLFFFFLAVTVGSLTIAVAPVRSVWFDRSWFRPVAEMVEGWQAIKSEKRLAGRLLIVVLANGLVQGLMIYICFQGLGLNLGAAGAVLVTALLSLSSLISITPGSLGIQEAVLVFSTQALGLQPAHSLAAAVTIRVVILFWTLTLGPIFAWVLMGAKKGDSAGS